MIIHFGTVLLAHRIAVQGITVLLTHGLVHDLLANQSKGLQGGFLLAHGIAVHGIVIHGIAVHTIAVLLAHGLAHDLLTHDLLAPDNAVHGIAVLLLHGINHDLSHCLLAHDLIVHGLAHDLFAHDCDHCN